MQNISFFFYTICLLSLSLPCPAKSEFLLNTPNQIAAPHQTYPLQFIINSKRGELTKDKKLTLSLFETHYLTSCEISNNKNNESAEKLNTQHFLRTWQSNYSTKKVKVDLSGVQVNNRTIGHTQFYATVLLSHPFISNDKPAITFEVTAIHPIQINKIARFLNVTLYIDGCSLLKCSKKPHCKI